MKYKKDKKLENECVKCKEETGLCEPINCNELIKGEN